MRRWNIAALVVMIAIIAIGARFFTKTVSKSEQTYRSSQEVMRDTNNTSSNSNWLAANPQQATAAQHAIVAQLDDFKHNNYADAMHYQADSLRLRFPSQQKFESMIKRGYPEFANYQSVKFGKAMTEPHEGVIAQVTTLTGADGITVKAVYLMHFESSGYRVAGVSGGQITRPMPKPNAKQQS